MAVVLVHRGPSLTEERYEETVRNPFGEVLAPSLQEVGVVEQPELYQAHTFVSA
jgi:hypothetical protein